MTAEQPNSLIVVQITDPVYQAVKLTDFIQKSKNLVTRRDRYIISIFLADAGDEVNEPASRVTGNANHYQIVFSLVSAEKTDEHN